MRTCGVRHCKSMYKCALCGYAYGCTGTKKVPQDLLHVCRAEERTCCRHADDTTGQNHGGVCLVLRGRNHRVKGTLVGGRKYITTVQAHPRCGNVDRKYRRVIHGYSKTFTGATHGLTKDAYPRFLHFVRGDCTAKVENASRLRGHNNLRSNLRESETETERKPSLAKHTDLRIAASTDPQPTLRTRQHM